MPNHKKQLKFVIYSPPYNDNIGGVIVLHKLCHLINKAGAKAALYPLIPSFEINSRTLNLASQYISNIRSSLSSSTFKINPSIASPVITPRENFALGDDCCAIYPEIVFGNPLGAKNVVRWLLHNPGFHTGTFYYGIRELIIRYSDIVADFYYPGSKTSQNFLTVTHSPLELYQVRTESERRGSAYCLRKGKDRPIQHDLTDSILIDGKSHREVAEIFRRVKTFYSYDTETAYSSYAALSGCDSVVIPRPGVPIEQWRPTEADRAGIAYGIEDIERARNTREHVRDRLLQLEMDSFDSVKKFIQEVQDHFSNN